tara:strand:- start:1119 stop:1745 length:627 start_codon:yes stop_codon:yes gene_type:complete
MRTKEEEIVNATSHLFASIVSFFITSLLVFKFSVITSLPIFVLGYTASWTFFSSFLYHSSFKEPQRSRNRQVDIAGIYIMISGTGISFSLTHSFSIVSFIVCCLIFATAAALLTIFCLRSNKSESFLITSCVLLSWLSILPSAIIFWSSGTIEPLVIILLLVGGIAYSVGLAFYVRDTKKWYHTAWHICVMTGFCCHYIAEYMLLITI